MTNFEFKKISPKERSDYRELISFVSEAVWPEFMLQDPVASVHWDGLFGIFPDYQFALVDQKSGAVAGIANSVPLSWLVGLDELPEEGWDWALIKSASDYAEGLQTNMLCGLQISIAPDFQGRGLSRLFLREMGELARSRGLRTVIIPVRPSWKARYPLTPIDTYITWTDDRGFPYDPWLRVHIRNGGRILKVCHSAMKVVGKLSEWEQWTNLRFFESGEYIVPGALVPIQIDLDGDLGTYVEPNVWVVHQVIGK